MRRGTSSQVEDCSRMHADMQGTSSSAGPPVSGTDRWRTPAHDPDVACRGPHRSRHSPPAPLSAHGVDGVRGPGVDQTRPILGSGGQRQPGLSGFSLLGHGREAFIVRLTLAELAERSLDMQYYVWDGDTTGRIIVDRVMKAADRGVRVRLLIDDPYNKASDPLQTPPMAPRRSPRMARNNLPRCMPGRWPPRPGREQPAGVTG